MEIKQISLEAGQPVKALVEMDFQVLVYLAVFTGAQSPKTAEEILPGVGGYANSVIYECLSGELFNRFFDGGVAEAKREVE